MTSRGCKPVRVMALAIVAVIAASTASRAAIPEPDVIFHGVPRLDGVVLVPGDEVSLTIGSDVLESYVIGEPEGAGDGRYVLRVPLVHLATGETRPADRAVQGARATVFCRKAGGPSVPGGEVTIGERGTITSRDLNCLTGVPTTTTSSLPGTTTTTIFGATTTTVVGATTTTAPVTTTTIPATCGNGVLDLEESCGDPGTAGCGEDERCVACKCESCPSMTLECSEWVRSLGGALRRASLMIDAGGQSVAVVQLRWDAAQMHVDWVGEPGAAEAESPESTLSCAIDQERAAASCEQTALAGERVGSITTVEVLATPLGDAGSRLRVERVLDVAAQTFEGCELPPGCCVVATDCDPGDRCHEPPTCGSDNHCRAGGPISCDDGDLCTTDTCDPARGCGHAPVSGCCNTDADCADADFCNGAESCANHACTRGTPLDCDDGDACTEDSCAPASGCAFADLELPESKRAGVVCAITNLRTLLPELEGSTTKTKRQISVPLGQIESTLNAAAAATKEKRCSRKLGAAVRKAKALLKASNKLANKDALGASGQELIDLLEDLRDRITRAQQGAAVFCAKP